MDALIHPGKILFVLGPVVCVPLVFTQCLPNRLTESFAHSDVVYNQTMDLWACCGYPEDPSGFADCSQPENITFQASDPQILLSEDYPISNPSL